MIYGKNKALDMSRSLLPSTRGKGAREDKNDLKRAVRHSIRNELHKATIDPEYYDDCSTDFEAYPDHDISEVVWERRQGDKTHPFERWAEAITKKVDQDSRLTYVKSLVPEGVIGDHALSHLEWKEHFASRAEKDLDENIRLNRQENRINNRFEKPAKKYFTHEERIELLHKIIEDGRLHRELNKFMDEHSGRPWPTETERSRVFNEVTNQWEIKVKTIHLSFPPNTKRGIRKLLGIHDIENYLKDISNLYRQPPIIEIDGKRYSNPQSFERANHALDTFLEALYNKKPVPRRLRPF